jgi:alpha-beta hydrolase superfamily lysophospholipase
MITRKPKLRSFVKMIAWIVLVQLVLLNVSAAIYAYKFTHLKDGPVPRPGSSNLLVRTWKLFTGPKLYKMSSLHQPDFPYEDIHMILHNKDSIQGWYSGVDSSRRCVIFFHGITSNKSTFLSEALRFRNWGYNVLLVDFRGHGSSGGHTTSFGVEETEEVEKAFAFARKRGNSAILLYGSSMGAAVIMRAVAENKVRPSGIVADMPFGSLHDQYRARARVLGFPAEPFAFLTTWWTGVERGYNGFKHNCYRYASKIDCPVLLEWGTRDPYVTGAEIQKIYKNLKTPSKTLAVYPDAGHESLLYADPLKWEKEVGAFASSLQ